MSFTLLVIIGIIASIALISIVLSLFGIIRLSKLIFGVACSAAVIGLLLLILAWLNVIEIKSSKAASDTTERTSLSNQPDQSGAANQNPGNYSSGSGEVNCDSLIKSKMAKMYYDKGLRLKSITTTFYDDNKQPRVTNTNPGPSKLKRPSGPANTNPGPSTNPSKQKINAPGTNPSRTEDVRLAGDLYEPQYNGDQGITFSEDSKMRYFIKSAQLDAGAVKFTKMGLSAPLFNGQDNSNEFFWDKNLALWIYDSQEVVTVTRLSQSDRIGWCAFIGTASGPGWSFPAYLPHEIFKTGSSSIMTAIANGEVEKNNAGGYEYRSVIQYKKKGN